MLFTLAMLNQGKTTKNGFNNGSTEKYFLISVDYSAFLNSFMAFDPKNNNKKLKHVRLTSTLIETKHSSKNSQTKITLVLFIRYETSHTFLWNLKYKKHCFGFLWFASFTIHTLITLPALLIFFSNLPTLLSFHSKRYTNPLAPKWKSFGTCVVLEPNKQLPPTASFFKKWQFTCGF